MAGAVALVALVAIVAFSPGWLVGLSAGSPSLTAPERLSAESEARSAIVALIGGLGVAGGLITATMGVVQRRDEQSAELFLRAMEKLTESGAGQLYAVNVLDRVADVSPAYRAAVEGRLFDLIQQRMLAIDSDWAARFAESSGGLKPDKGAGKSVSAEGGNIVVVMPSPSAAKRAPDPLIQAAVEALGRPRKRRRRQPARLERLRVRTLEMEGLDFEGCCLRSAGFLDARLNGTSFRKASLHRASLSYCELDGADFRGADLRGASISAKLVGILTDGRPDGSGRNTTPRLRFGKAWYDSATMVEPAELLAQLHREGRRSETVDPLIPGCR